MTTLLQQAAQAVIARWDSPLWKDQPHTGVYIAELHKALEAELQQAVEPVHGWLTACDEEMIGAQIGVANLSDSYASAKAKLRALIDWNVGVATDPAVNGGLSLQPAPPAMHLSEILAEKGVRLRTEFEPKTRKHIPDAGKMVGEQAPYDQQALELCQSCGWKAIMPGEPCFVCNMQTDASQVAVPMTPEEAQKVLGLVMLPGIAVMRDVRRIEAHHGITPQGGKP